MSITVDDVTDTLKPEHQKYESALKAAAECYSDASALVTGADFANKKGWKNEGENDEGDIVYTKHTKNGKMVTVSTILEGNVDDVFNETWIGFNDLPNWNPNINYARTLAQLTDHVDIVTYGNNDVLIVTGREFVTTRIWRRLPAGGYRAASKSIELDDMPHRKDRVRAELQLAVFQLHPDPADPVNKTQCDVVMNIDLKGMLPKFLINQVLPKLALMDTDLNKQHFKELAQKKASAVA